MSPAASGCQNTVISLPSVVDAIKAQADEFLHQCFHGRGLRAVV